MEKIIASILILGGLLAASIASVNAYEIKYDVSKEFEFSAVIDDEVFDGYTLYAPVYSSKTYLIDNNGEIVHTWKSRYIASIGIYLLKNGCLLRSACSRLNPAFGFIGSGLTGYVEILDWNGTRLWEFEYSNNKHCLSHDIEPLPNGNILMIAWEKKTRAETIAAGRDPRSVAYRGFLVDYIIEVEPIFPKGGNIVWEWHVWDHLIQDYDPTKDNYGAVADHPELIDLNIPTHRLEFSHINTIDYNEEFDQILLSSAFFSEIFVIDHSTTTEEAAGHTGGEYGKGGDLLYRWGNPQNYRAGNADDMKLVFQHDARWVEPGCPGEGHITVFNNRRDCLGKYSSVVEIIPPVDSNGNYNLESGSSYGPEEPIWTYTANPPTDIYSDSISGAQRLPNGNTLLCSGQEGLFLEVTHDKKVVWEYTNPYPIPIFNFHKVFKTQSYPPDYLGIGDLSIRFC